MAGGRAADGSEELPLEHRERRAVAHSGDLAPTSAAHGTYTHTAENAAAGPSPTVRTVHFTAESATTQLVAVAADATAAGMKWHQHGWYTIHEAILEGRRQALTGGAETTASLFATCRSAVVVPNRIVLYSHFPPKMPARQPPCCCAAQAARRLLARARPFGSPESPSAAGTRCRPSAYHRLGVQLDRLFCGGPPTRCCNWRTRSLKTKRDRVVTSRSGRALRTW